MPLAAADGAETRSAVCVTAGIYAQPQGAMARTDDAFFRLFWGRAESLSARRSMNPPKPILRRALPTSRGSPMPLGHRLFVSVFAAGIFLGVDAIQPPIGHIGAWETSPGATVDSPTGGLSRKNNLTRRDTIIPRLRHKGLVGPGPPRLGVTNSANRLWPERRTPVLLYT